MRKHMIVDGIRFTRVGGRKYYYNTKIRRHVHQYLWEKEHGEIPAGYEVHHIDHNTENNALSNLIAMPAEEHRKHHMMNMSEERKEQCRQQANKIRHLTKEWHASEEGHIWHKEHYENVKENLYRKEIKACKHCNIEFEGYIGNGNLFCSNKCKSAWRRKQGFDNELYTCEVCGEEYVANKYLKGRTCSKKCAGKLRIKIEERTCVICSTSFTVTPHKKTQTCSKECKYKLIAKTNKKNKT